MENQSWLLWWKHDEKEISPIPIEYFVVFLRILFKEF